jgi:DNA modification methylase
VNYDPSWRDKSLGTWSQPRSVGTVENDDRADWSEAYSLFPGDVTYVWHPAGARQVEFFNSLVASGFEIRMQIIWAKSHFPIGRGNYHVQHEPCWYAVRKGKTGHWSGDRKQSTLWQIANMSAFRGGERKPEDAKSGHGTQKPVECMKRPIENNSSPGQAVYEPFSGSGTTIIAAEMTGRTCHAIEITPAYVDLAVKRWQDFTGKQATLDGDGRTFDDVAAQRVTQPEVTELGVS